jgi:hypothetical protein
VKVTARDVASELRTDDDLQIARQALVEAMKSAVTSLAYVQLNNSVTRITTILQIRRGEAVVDLE